VHTVIVAGTLFIGVHRMLSLLNFPAFIRNRKRRVSSERADLRPGSTVHAGFFSSEPVLFHGGLREQIPRLPCPRWVMFAPVCFSALHCKSQLCRRMRSLLGGSNKRRRRACAIGPPAGGHFLAFPSPPPLKVLGGKQPVRQIRPPLWGGI
jgi:hypothetical protein